MDGHPQGEQAQYGFYGHHMSPGPPMHQERMHAMPEEGPRGHALVPNTKAAAAASSAANSVFANASHGLTGDNQRKLADYWQQTITDIENSSHDFKSHALPLARIKKVMKADEDVKMISAEAPILFAKGCEIFITELTMRAWIHAEENKRRTLQRSDIANAISRSDMFDFLIDIVPREEFVAGAHGIAEAGSDAQPVAGAAGGFMGMTLGHAAAAAVQSHTPQHMMPEHGRAPMPAETQYYAHNLKTEKPPMENQYAHHPPQQQQQQQHHQASHQLQQHHHQPHPQQHHQQQQHQHQFHQQHQQPQQHPQQHHHRQQQQQHMYDQNRYSIPPVGMPPPMPSHQPSYLDQMHYHQSFNQHNGGQPGYGNPYNNPYVAQHHAPPMHHQHGREQEGGGDPSGRGHGQR